MVIGFCVGWVSALVFIWVIIHKFDHSGKIASLLLGEKGLTLNKEISNPLEEQIQQLSALIRDNTELLHTLREIAPATETRKKNIQTQIIKSEPVVDNSEREVLQNSTKKKKQSVSVTEVYLEGVLHLKLGNSWQKYYCVLTTTQISLYRQKNDTKRLAHLKLANCIIREEEKKFSFSIENLRHSIIGIDGPNTSQEFTPVTKCVFGSKIQDEIKEWFSAIDRCIKLANKLVNEEKNDFPGDEDTFEEEKDDFLDDDFGEGNDKSGDFDEIEKEEKEEEKEEVSEEIILRAAKDKQETAALKKMIKALGKSFNYKLHDGFMLMRFLRARQLDPVKAITMMNARLEWEKKFKPYEITIDHIRSEAVKKKGFFHCHDKEKQPCIIILVAKHQPKTSDLNTTLKLMIYFLETAIAKAPKGVEKFSTIFDCTGFAINQMDWPLVKDGIATLQNYYPERLGALYIVNYPMVINMLWKMIKPWLDQRTSDKIQFVDTKRVKQFFDAKYLPKRYGGTSNYEDAVDFLLGVETLDPGYVPPQVD